MAKAVSKAAEPKAAAAAGREGASSTAAMWPHRGSTLTCMTALLLSRKQQWPAQNFATCKLPAHLMSSPQHACAGPDNVLQTAHARQLIQTPKARELTVSRKYSAPPMISKRVFFSRNTCRLRRPRRRLVAAEGYAAAQQNSPPAPGLLAPPSSSVPSPASVGTKSADFQHRHLLTQRAYGFSTGLCTHSTRSWHQQRQYVLPGRNACMLLVLHE